MNKQIVKIIKKNQQILKNEKSENEKMEIEKLKNCIIGELKN